MLGNDFLNSCCKNVVHAQSVVKLEFLDRVCVCVCIQPQLKK